MAPQPPPEGGSRWRAMAWWLVAAHALLAWWSFGGVPIGASWREADTQAIARNLASEDFDVLRPRVDWRGDTAGFVECEFPLYQAVVATVLRVAGDVEWPGRLLSLLATSVAALALFSLCARRCGGGAAWLGTLAFLGSAQSVFLGARVMPDMFSAALALLGLAAFAAWLANGRLGLLLAAGLATWLGVMAKPTAAQVVLVQIAWAVLLAPARLRAVLPWLVWGGIAASVAAWTLHARALGLATGLTFGVTFGDTKLPGVEHLLRPSVWRSLATATLEYGASWFGILAGAVLLVRRRLARDDLALLAAVAIALVGSLRYSHDVQMGPQYHLWSAVAGAWLVARAWPAVAGRAAWGVAVALLVAHAAWCWHGEVRTRAAAASATHVQTAADLSRLSAPGDLVVIRGPKGAYDAFWRRPHNFEEPVLLYLGRRKGWVLPVDGTDAKALAACAARGARWFVDPSPGGVTADGAAWLAEHAELVESSERATIHRLRP